MNNKMVLTAEAYGKKTILEIPCDCNIYDFLTACRVLAIGLTYHEHCFDDAILEKADEIKHDRKEVIADGDV